MYGWLAGIVILGALAYLVAAASIFRSRAKELRARLVAGQRAAHTAADLERIPPLVRDFALRNGGTVGGPSVIEARQRAQLRTAPDRPYFDIIARQTIGTRAAGIVWTASGTMPPAIPVSGLDSYVAGCGVFEIRLLGAIKVASSSGPEAAAGELIRYLSELPNYPDAILNVGELSWRQIDDHRVAVTASTAYGPASVTFLFNEAGDIIGLDAERPRDVGNGKMITTPWHGTYADYRWFGKYRLPAHGEVGWQLPAGLFVYWRGELASYFPAADPAFGSIKSHLLP